METYSALLHCTHRAKPDDNVSILITPTSTEAEYVRVRDVGDASHTLISSSHQARFTRQQIHVLVDPTEPPVNIFNGFWLRTPQPPVHAQHQTVVLSNSRAPGTDYIYQHAYSHGLAGLVHMGSKTATECWEWSHVHWIEFGFDTKFNPVLWFARAKHSRRLQGDFEEALALGPESDLHQKIMRVSQNDTEGSWSSNWSSNAPNAGGSWPNENDMDDKWAEGAFTITIDKKKGYYNHIVSALNLRISVQLQLRHERTTNAVETDDSGLPLSPMKIWVVDITDTGGETPEERKRRRCEERSAERRRQEEEDRQRQEEDRWRQEEDRWRKFLADCDERDKRRREISAERGRRPDPCTLCFWGCLSQVAFFGINFFFATLGPGKGNSRGVGTGNDTKSLDLR